MTLETRGRSLSDSSVHAAALAARADARTQRSLSFSAALPRADSHAAGREASSWRDGAMRAASPARARVERQEGPAGARTELSRIAGRPALTIDEAILTPGLRHSIRSGGSVELVFHHGVRAVYAGEGARGTLRIVFGDHRFSPHGVISVHAGPPQMLFYADQPLTDRQADAVVASGLMSREAIAALGMTRGPDGFSPGSYRVAGVNANSAWGWIWPSGDGGLVAQRGEEVSREVHHAWTRVVPASQMTSVRQGTAVLTGEAAPADVDELLWLLASSFGDIETLLAWLDLVAPSNNAAFRRLRW